MNDFFLKIYMRFMHIYEVVMMDGFFSLFRQVIYFNREAIVLEKNLEMLNSKQYSSTDNMQILLLDRNNYNEKNLKFRVKSRYLKVILNLKKCGYGVILLVRDDIVLGDIWFYDSSKCNNIDHFDINWFGINVNGSKNYVYLFDMFINPKERGKNLAAALQGGALSLLHQLGYTKAFGFYWADNIPALWVNRLLKWQEIKRIKMNRFLLYKSTSS